MNKSEEWKNGCEKIPIRPTLDEILKSEYLNYSFDHIFPQVGDENFNLVSNKPIGYLHKFEFKNGNDTFIIYKIEKY